MIMHTTPVYSLNLSRRDYKLLSLISGQKLCKQKYNVKRKLHTVMIMISHIQWKWKINIRTAYNYRYDTVNNWLNTQSQRDMKLITCTCH